VASVSVFSIVFLHNGQRYRRICRLRNRTGTEFFRGAGTTASPEGVQRTAGCLVRALTDNDCDVALLGVDPERGTDVTFSPPYLRADFTFLVQADSRIDRISHVDQPGERVAVVRNHAMEFALKGKRLRADWVYARTPDEGFDMVQAGHADILAGIRPGLLRYADLLPGSRVLQGRYGENALALAVAKGRDDWLPAVNHFVLNARTSGLIQRIVQATGLDGVTPVLTS